jgi:excisionase family DNA binding protein
MNPDARGKRVYDVREMAALTGLPEGTLYRLAAAKQLPTVRLGRSVFFPKAAVDRLLDGEAGTDARASR